MCLKFVLKCLMASKQLYSLMSNSPSCQHSRMVNSDVSGHSLHSGVLYFELKFQQILTQEISPTLKVALEKWSLRLLLFAKQSPQYLMPYIALIVYYVLKKQFPNFSASDQEECDTDTWLNIQALLMRSKLKVVKWLHNQHQQPMKRQLCCFYIYTSRLFFVFYTFYKTHMLSC